MLPLGVNWLCTVMVMHVMLLVMNTLVIVSMNNLIMPQGFLKTYWGTGLVNPWAVRVRGGPPPHECVGLTLFIVPTNNLMIMPYQGLVLGESPSWVWE